MIIYTIGPITGTSYSECTDWREYAKQVLDTKGFNVISPMREKAFLKHETHILESYEDNSLASKHTIFARDKFDACRSDIFLVNFLGAKIPSIGSVAEMAWGNILGKFIVLVMEDAGNPHEHAFVKEMSSIRFNDLDKAIDYIIKVFDRDTRVKK